MNNINPERTVDMITKRNRSILSRFQADAADNLEQQQIITS